MQCLNCQTELDETDFSNRHDRVFCSAVCKAAYHRSDGASGEHISLPEDISLTCDVCGESFTVNEYANRGGERVPLYCSGKCRQKAYRQRKKKL